MSGTLILLESYKEKGVDKEISIVGEPTVNPAACRFTVDRPVYAGGSAYFKNREAAEHSPLAKKIFEIPEVENILIAENQVTVTKVRIRSVARDRQADRRKNQGAHPFQ